MKLENDIPVPKPYQRLTKVTQLLMDAKIGQSLIVTTDDVGAKPENLYHACNGYKATVMHKHKTRNFRVVKIDESSCGIWRIK